MKVCRVPSPVVSISIHVNCMTKRPLRPCLLSGYTSATWKASLRPLLPKPRIDGPCGMSPASSSRELDWFGWASVQRFRVDVRTCVPSGRAPPSFRIQDSASEGHEDRPRNFVRIRGVRPARPKDATRNTKDKRRAPTKALIGFTLHRTCYC